MSLPGYENQQKIQHTPRVTRWAARGLALLFIGFNLLLLALNEDFRNSPTLPTVVFWILAISMLIAWRWERTGGLLTIILSLALPISIIVQWSETAGLVTSTWQLFLIGFSLTIPFLIIGSLFVYTDRQSQIARGYTTEDQSNSPSEKPTRTYRLIGLLALLAIIFFAIPFSIPIRQEFNNPEGEQISTNYQQLIDDLRAYGAEVSQNIALVDHPLFSAAGIELNVDGQIVQAFEYPDVAAATADASAIYFGENAAWDKLSRDGTAHTYQVKNILLLYTGDDESLVMTLEIVFGPPFGEG